ncbi:hypothetical protein [Haloferula sp. BvORR071]|uniref:hypothetical protein n=1 Tax=Haloferula sp. BvORR071 TaxID=1396141 RepID=UPI002240EE4E|nr:hypothetical protein [Haloferula sp. BvORR071]
MEIRTAERGEVAARSDVAAALGEFEKEWDALRKEAGTENGSLPASGLREKIAALKKALAALPGDTEWSTSEDFEQRLAAAAKELGRREGEEAIRWLETIDPQLCFTAMDGWADAEPDAAFEAVVSSQRPVFCEKDAMLRMLQGKAASGNAAFLAACRQVPWELILGAQRDPFDDAALYLDEKQDIEPWLRSGAALELSEQGVRIRNLFDRWAKIDASEAFQAALAWPRSSDSEILGVLGVAINDQVKGDEIRSLLDTLPPEQFRQVAVAVTKYCKRPSTFGERLASNYPMLISEDSGKEAE